mgnify:CR=1 FL=1
MITKQELKVVAVLASIFALRMLGLCMLLPIFAVEAARYAQATPQLIGIAAGIYGLSQAVLQIPFGLLSDRYGRKPLILTGLLCILSGSLISAIATNIYLLILGRLLQGCGAIGSVVIATLIDNVRTQVRASAMAILGASIGVSFALAMVLGPALNQLIGLAGVFEVIAVLAVACVALLLVIPNVRVNLTTKTPPSIISALQRAFIGRVLSTHVGVFILHASLAAIFLILPGLLQQYTVVAEHLWQFYLLVLIISMLAAWCVIKYAERRHNLEKVQLLAIIGLLFAQGLLYTINSYVWMAVDLVLFFTAFCFLEASLPALLSKFVTSDNRGAAFGAYACLQFLGVFVGGTAGGWMHANLGVIGVLSFCVVLGIIWLAAYVGQHWLSKRWVLWQEV